MCFVLYAGTRVPLPRKVWRQEAPDLHVQSLSEREIPVKAHFSSPEVQYIGSTSDCGCDFPHLATAERNWTKLDISFPVEQDAEQLASEHFNRDALFKLLRDSGEEAIELYGLWDGDFAEPPVAREVVSLQRILDLDFRFVERGFYTVIAEKHATGTPPGE